MATAGLYLLAHCVVLHRSDSKACGFDSFAVTSSYSWLDEPWLGKVERLQSGVQRTGDLSRHPEDERGIALEVPEVDGKKGV